MKILGIETSCDETAVCLIEASGEFPKVGFLSLGLKNPTFEPFQFKVLGNALYSQVAIHAPYGGVFPNLAKREHAKNLVPLLLQVLEQSHSLVQGYVSGKLDGLREILSREQELFDQLSVFLGQYGKPDIDAIAVTTGPGLEPALWVGVNFARALNLAWDIPIVAVNHMEGHIIMSMAQDGGLTSFEFPLLSLLISGGHTELVLSREWMHYERIGETRDDAIGEAFDKVARMLGLPYPGGPEISRLAQESRANNSVEYITPFVLPRPMIHENNYDFSFSGLKTAVKRIVETHPNMSADNKKSLAREFEDATADVLIAKTLRAVEEYGVQTVVVGGGVSANTYIREELASTLSQLSTVKCQLLFPSPELATDNAIMIALVGYFHAIKKEFADTESLRANGILRLL